jgi:aminopeptidase N
VTILRKGTWFIGRYTGESEIARLKAGAVPPPQGRSYAPDKLVDVLHIKLEVSFDLAGKAVRGTATHTVSPLTDGLDHLVLDCVELTVEGVTDGKGRVLPFDWDGEKLTIAFPKPLGAGHPIEVSVRYHGTPRSGLYFTGPSEAYPETALQVWSQGQDEDSRHWFPCFDYPNEKATSETLVTVPESWTVVGNGALVGVTSDRRRGTKTWHHRMEVPHVSYLLSIACGEFAKIEDSWRGTPVQYFVKPGQEKQARRAFSLTPDMIEHFSETFGYAYPYPKYSQVVVEDFIFGGMENISATTLIDRCLMDERASLDYEPQDLISHELAHQWFGDLVTCKDWSHAWLNEGFATFCEVVYREHWRGGEDAGYHRLQQMQSYFERDRSERRPIVTKAYTLPMELFDQHIYEKGGLVLHMLRHVLGDGPFWASVRAYLHEYAGRNVQTEDLIGVINRVTGKNLEWFFDQWVFGAGFPEFEVSYAWDEKHKTATLTVDQKQKVDERTPVFRTPVTVRFHGRRPVEEGIVVSQAHQLFSFRLEEKPAFASFDPGFHILKKLTFKKPPEMLKTQIVKDPDWFGRVEAAQALCREGSREALDAVGKALRSDPFWGARAEMAAALGENGSLHSRDLLIKALGTKDHKVRRALVRALGQFQDEIAAKALLPLARKDPSYFVEGEANAALGATRQTLAFDALERAVRKESHLDVIRAGALSGLARLRDERAWPLLRACAAPGGKPQGRIAAMRAMAAMARGREPQRFDVRQELERYLYDANFFAKFGAMMALELLDEPAAALELERIGQREVDGRIRMNARDIARALREGKSKGEEIVRLRGDLEKLREERRALEDRVAKLEALAAPKRPRTQERRRAASKGRPKR